MAPDPQQGALHARRRREVAASDAAGDADLEPGLVQERELRLTRCAGEFLGGFSLHDEHRFVRRARGVQQLAHDGGGDAVGHVRDDAVRGRWQRERQEVRVSRRDVRAAREPLAQNAEEPFVLLDGDHAEVGVRKRLRELAVSRTRFDDKRARWERQPPHEGAGDRGIAQEVLRQFGVAMSNPGIVATHPVPPAGRRRDVAHESAWITDGRRHRRRQQARNYESCDRR